MPCERFFKEQPLNSGDLVMIEDQEFHHLIHVMRARAGESVEIVNGHGQLAKCTVETIEKKKAYIRLDASQEEPPTQNSLILAQAIPRVNRLETILEKATELGATEIWLFASKHSERKNFTEHQIDRLKAITIAAMKQCGRLYLPKLVIASSIEELPSFPQGAFYGDVHDQKAQSLAIAMQGHKNLLICIGPESGFTDAEEAELKAKGAKGTLLHKNILRTDTAAIAALTILSHQL